MRKIGIDVKRDAVQRRPSPHAHADGGDLVLGCFAQRGRRLIGSRDPYANPVLARLADDVERFQRLDQPAFERGHIGSHVGSAALEVEHDVSDPLSGSVIGELAAAASAMDGKARLDKVALLGARACGVKRRVLDEPDALGRVSARDRLRARLHLHERVGIFRQSGCDDPFDGRRIMRGKQRRAGGKARIEHGRFLSEGALTREQGRRPTAGSIESDRFP